MTQTQTCSAYTDQVSLQEPAHGCHVWKHGEDRGGSGGNEVQGWTSRRTAGRWSKPAGTRGQGLADQGEGVSGRGRDSGGDGGEPPGRVTGGER